MPLLLMRDNHRSARRSKRAIARHLRKHATVEERILWQELRRNQLNGFHFRRQHVLAGFIVDFYCHEARLVIELDGNHHEKQETADQERDFALGRIGATVMRIPNHQVREDLARVLERIEEAVTERTRPGVPLPRSGEGVRG